MTAATQSRPADAPRPAVASASAVAAGPRGPLEEHRRTTERVRESLTRGVAYVKEQDR